MNALSAHRVFWTPAHQAMLESYDRKTAGWASRVRFDPPPLVHGSDAVPVDCTAVSGLPHDALLLVPEELGSRPIEAA